MFQTLSEAMDSKGLTTYRLALKAGMPMATALDVCNGAIPLKSCEPGLLGRIAKALDMSVDEVVGLENRPVVSEMTGRPVDQSYLEKDLPPYLQKAIDDLLTAFKDGVEFLDTYMDEIYGSINSAYIDGEISKAQAEFLRDKYLGI